MPVSPNYGPFDDHNTDGRDLFPLSGKNVVVTRAAGQADSLSIMLENLGAQTFLHPVIQILPPEDTSDLDYWISRIHEFDWFVFVSTNSVRYFFERLQAVAGNCESLQGKKIATIGQSTRKWLEKHTDFQVDLVPPTSNSLSLGQSFQSILGKDHKLLIARADRRTSTLTDLLTETGIDFEEVITYRNCDVTAAQPAVVAMLAGGAIDWVTITSVAIARSAFRIFGDEIRKAKLVSISPATSHAIVELGLKPVAEAANYDMGGIVEAIRQFETQPDPDS